MDFTKSFERLNEAFKDIMPLKHGYGKEQFSNYRYADCDLNDACPFKNIGAEAYLLLPETKIKKVHGWCTADDLYNDCYPGSWRDAAIHLWASDEYKAYHFSVSCPIAFGIPWESVAESQSADVEFGYDKHFYFSYFYLLNYGPKILKDVQKYLMQDVDDPMDTLRVDGKRMTRAQAYKVIDQREKAIKTLYKKDFVETFVIPYYEAHPKDYDLDMHATPREIYDRIINDTAKCEELGIKQTKVEKAAIRKRFG